jgi:hypothetical protein
MVGNTFATGSFPGARLVGAVTFSKVLFPITFHGFLPPDMVKKMQ